jgi:curved DNA-binding protein CbpA
MTKRALSEEFKEEITQLVGSLKQHNFYTILGVTVDATKEEIRKSYFALSKIYHPDSFYGEDLGAFQVYLETLFRSITRAHDVLTDPARRERYNRYLQQKKDLRGMESTAAKGVSEVREHIMRKTGIMPAISITGADVDAVPPEAQPAPAPSPEQQPVKTFDSARLDASAQRHQQWKKRRLMSLLNIQAARVEERKVTEEACRKIQDLLRSAEEAEKEENYLGAMGAIQVAISLDPDNGDLHERFKASLRKMAPLLGQKYYAMGISEEEFGDRFSAAESFQKAVEYCPENAEFNFRLAMAVFEGDGDLRRAYNAARRAIALSPTDGSYYLLFAKICLKAGMAKSAESALKACLKYDAKNQEARQLLKQF